MTPIPFRPLGRVAAGLDTGGQALDRMGRGVTV